MSDIGDIWRQAAAKWSEVSAQVSDDDWGKPTTCDDWTVRDLVDHAMHWQGMGGGIVGAGTTAGDDWATIEPKLSAALDDPTNLEGTAEEMGGHAQAAGCRVPGRRPGDPHVGSRPRSVPTRPCRPAPCEATLMGLQRVPAGDAPSVTMFGDPDRRRRRRQRSRTACSASSAAPRNDPPSRSAVTQLSPMGSRHPGRCRR